MININYRGSKVIKDTVMKLTEEAKREAKLFFDFFEICEGIDDSRIELISNKKESEMAEIFLLRVKESLDTFLVRKIKDSSGAPKKLTIDQCKIINRKIIINNKIFSKRTMTINEDFANVNFKVNKNNSNKTLELNIGIEYSGDELFTQIREQKTLFIPAQNGISNDMMNKLTSRIEEIQALEICKIS